MGEHTTYLTLLGANTFLAAVTICNSSAKIFTLKGESVDFVPVFLGIFSNLDSIDDYVYKSNALLLQLNDKKYLFQADEHEIDEIERGLELFRRLIKTDCPKFEILPKPSITQ